MKWANDQPDHFPLGVLTHALPQQKELIPMKRKKKVTHTQRPAPPPPAGRTPAKPILPPDRYMLRIRIQHCCCCANTERSTELFAETTVFGPNGGIIHHLQRVAEPEFSLPYTIRTLPLEEIPFCHACADTDIYATLQRLPSPPKPNYQRPLFHITETQHLEREALRAVRVPNTAAPRATLDDIGQL